MKKNVIALAVAAAMVAPAAMAEVKISGGLQAQMVNISGDSNMADGWYATDGGQYQRENSGSWGHLKFTAKEDLGNGLTALAKYNFAINVGDGGVTGAAAGLGARDSFVGIKGGFGTVVAGTMSSPYKSSTVKWDPFVTTFAQARGNGGMSTFHNGYAGNVVAYKNKFGMAKVTAAISLDEQNNTSQDDKTVAQHAKSISVNVPVGPVEIAVAYLDASNFNNDPNVAGSGLGDNATALKIGVKYTAGAITVAAQNENLDEGAGDGSLTYLTGSYAVGANTYSLGYGMDDSGDRFGDDTTYTAIGVNHKFSKKVSANVAYRAIDVKDAGETVFGAGLRVGF